MSLKEKLERFAKDESGNLSILIEIAIVIAVLVVLFTVIPVIGYNVDNTVTLPATSNWNATNNQAITNGTELWGENSPMIGVGVLIGVIVVIISLLVGSIGGMTGGKQGGGGGL